MPAPEFFRNLGLYVVRGFLNPECCMRLCARTAAAPAEKGRVLRHGKHAVTDEEVRKVEAVDLPKSVTLSVTKRLLDLKPELERYFALALGTCERPQFLVYRQGDFFKPHTDANPDPTSPVADRRVSLVVFLNNECAEPAEDSYGSGHLTFHGLLNGPQWELCPLPLIAEAGLLIAFPSGLLHEVKPVTFGKRFTIVTWFGAPESAPRPLAPERERRESVT